MARDPLSTYKAKRDFTRTSEPEGTPKPTGAARKGRQARFVVQRHRATARHYDFRLEVDGVLASWAVPKGPTLDPDVKSLAVHVEDHPIEYYDFEGVIPRGSYGGGDVIVWDWGTWTPTTTDDPSAAIAAGEIHFDMSGEKLAGRFALVRTRRRQGNKEQWLLIKKHDDASQSGWNPEDHPRSVKSGRTNDEVAADPDALWHGDKPAAEAEERIDRARRSRRKRVTKKSRTGPTARQLERLDELGGTAKKKDGSWKIHGTEVKLTNLDKVLFPADDSLGRPAVTKRDLIRYYAEVAPTLLPYLSDRPVNLNRFPDGVTKKGFWQKAVPEHAPDWIQAWHYPDAAAGETQHYAILDEPEALVWAANQAAVEIHPWTSSAADHRHPTWALIDLDPGESTTFDDIVLLAQLHRAALDHLDVVARPKITGKRGIQIWIPVAPIYTFDETRDWVEKLSRAVGATVPEMVSWKWRTSDRSGLARLDYTQNAVNKTLVAPYSPRPAPGAPVSVPLEWDELDDEDLSPARWSIHDVGDRIDDVGDPFTAILGVDQVLPNL